MSTDLTPVSRTVRFDDLQRYASITKDPNPIHLDRAFAAATPVGGLIAHGTFTLNLIWQSFHRTLRDLEQRPVTLAVRFLAPVRENDTVTAGGTLESRAERAAKYAVWVHNQRGEKVVEGSLSWG